VPADRIPDVALVAPYPRLGVRHGGSSGVASYAANLAHGLADAGSTVTVVAPHEPGEPSNGHDGDVRVRRAFRRGVRALPTALAAARDTRAPVIHLQFELFLYGGAALPGLLAGLGVGRGRAQRHVVTMHQVVDPAGVDADFTALHRLPVRPAAARTAIGSVQRAISALADVLIVHEPSFASVLPGAVTVPHGVERVDAADREQARATLGLDNRFLALCFGFLAPYKGLELAGEAARLAGSDVHLVIAGGEHPRLERRDGYGAGLRQAFGDVATFPGFVPDADVHRWFQAADVVLLPYPAPHASSGALALALAHGKPVLASGPLARTCGLPTDVIVDDVETLAKQLRRLANDPSALAELAATTAPLGSDRSWSAVSRRHLEIYRAGIAA
jgi:glycosyltransferase involved in cell wall biosynthesis